MAPCISFGNSLGRHLLDWHEEERGAHPLSCIGMKGERERGYAPSLVHEIPRGCQVLGPHLPALYYKGCPLRLSYLTGVLHMLVKRD